MAKVIRNCWVHKKNNRWWRHLPRRVDHRLVYDYDAEENSLISFPDKMPVAPPKLWLAWLYVDTKAGLRRDTRHHIRQLFGDDAQPGEMRVFKNTLSTNKELWRVKHLIDIRPMTFPQGEPTAEDVFHLEVMPDGQCLILDEQEAPSPEGIVLLDESKQFTERRLQSILRTRDLGYKDVYEDTVYNPPNISILD